MRGIGLSREARDDLAGILEYISQDSLTAAYSVSERFEEVFQLLGENPYAGHIRPDLTSQVIRFFPVVSFLVAYTLVDGKPIVARIFGAGQDVASHLESRE